MSSSTPHPDATPATPAYAPDQPALDADVTPARSRSWRVAKGRRLVAAGAVVAGLAVGGAGFGAGYAAGHDGTTGTTTSTTDQTGLTGQQGFPAATADRWGTWTATATGPARWEARWGQMGAPPGSTGTDQGGTTGQAPDFDGDGQPDTDSGSTDDGSTSGSSQNS